MPCNSHDISEFDTPVSDYFAPGSQKVSIGAGLYPCLGDLSQVKCDIIVKKVPISQWARKFKKVQAKKTRKIK